MISTFVSTFIHCFRGFVLWQTTQSFHGWSVLPTFAMHKKNWAKQKSESAKTFILSALCIACAVRSCNFIILRQNALLYVSLSLFLVLYFKIIKINYLSPLYIICMYVYMFTRHFGWKSIDSFMVFPRIMANVATAPTRCKRGEMHRKTRPLNFTFLRRCRHVGSTLRLYTSDMCVHPHVPRRFSRGIVRRDVLTAIAASSPRLGCHRSWSGRKEYRYSIYIIAM